ncbi:hypothetical protein F5I97DRAFT_1926547 [Phlebopus sp. FC_14]|nr:hypothetical protein F5I97DRAFT_1926547 [Phlebopus sp. FC_14]
MIHLDRNHHDLDHNQHSNLILQDDHPQPHFVWDDDDSNSYFHDAALTDSLLGPLDAHHDAHQDHHDRKDRPRSPQHPPHDVHDDKSSSLSPAPESTTSPKHDSRNSPQQQPNGSIEPTAVKLDVDTPADGILTPLTDLSPAPEPDDSTDVDKKEDADEEHLNEQSRVSPASQDEKPAVSDKPTDQMQKGPHMNGMSSPSRSGGGSPVRQFSASATFQNPSSGQLPSHFNEKPTFAAHSHSRVPSGDFFTSSVLSSSGGPLAGAGHARSDSKVVRILELNAELLKVCLEFQLRGVPVAEPRFQQYASRLQTNLTWLAACADQRHHNPNMALPIMDPPLAVEFAAMDRIHHLYADLPTIFAKEIARRQLNNSQHASPTAPSAMPNGTLKRNRPDDGPDLASKRQNIGDNKLQSMQPPAVPSISLSGAGSRTSPSSSFATPNTNFAVPNSHGMPQSPRVSSPAMPPPSGAPSLPFGATEASIAASSRARAREMQMQQLRQTPHMPQMQNARHMTPSSTSPQTPQGVGGVPGGQQQSAIAPSPQQLMQILQNPAHPLMQYMIQQMPSFTSLPPQQQMQKLQALQNALNAQRQQQQQQNSAQQRNPQMSSMPQNPPMAMAMSNGTMTGGGGPSPVSPLAQQSPVMSQSQMSSQSPQNGMFPFNQGQTSSNPGMDPRLVGPNFMSQMSGNMTANQQRQLMFMQQQQQLRNGNMNMSVSAAPMTPQQQGYAMTQRMTAGAGPSQQPGGSPMSAPAGDTFPVLRSNSTIPGIARSARSPSDGAHSPMTPRAPSRLSQQPQMPANDYQQVTLHHAQSTMPQNAAPFNPQVQNHWPQNGQQPMQQQMGIGGGQMNGYSMSPPNSAGAGSGFFGGAPSPSSQNWQQGMTGSYPYGQASMGQQRSQTEQVRPTHLSGTPAPQNMGPMGDNSGNGEYDIFNYNGL